MAKGVYVDLVGKQFGHFTVLRRATREEYARGKKRKPMWLVQCDCGQTRLARAPHLKNGRVSICGINGHTTNSLKPKKPSKHLERNSWKGMQERCYDKRHKNFKSYGGRGITVCKRWRDNFEAFYEDMGPRPTPKHSIERMDNNGNYEPKNCKWATDEEQHLNTRRTVFVEVEGKMVHLQKYVKGLGLNPNRVYNRLKLGWTLEDAITIPIKRYKGGG